MSIWTGIATFLTIFSVSINFIQWFLKRADEKERIKVLTSRSQTSFNTFSEIEYQTSLIDKSNNIQEIKSYSRFIAGIARAARQDVVAYCREHLRLLPVEDLRQGKIYEGALPRISKK